MTSISIFPYYNSVMSKIIEPVRTPLQLYYMKRMINYIDEMSKYKLYENYEYGVVRYDVNDRTFKDTLGGARLQLPRPIVLDYSSGKADFTEILAEMYFCMLFNKNQDDPTHSSFQILTKILEGEKSMMEMKKINHHLGYSETTNDEEWAIDVIRNPHTHKFSSRSIEIGAKLLRIQQGYSTATEISMAKSKKEHK